MSHYSPRSSSSVDYSSCCHSHSYMSMYTTAYYIAMYQACCTLYESPTCALMACGVQGVLTTGSLADVTACHSKLSSYSAALQEELAARQAAVAALSAELAKQVRHNGSRWLLGYAALHFAQYQRVVAEVKVAVPAGLFC